MVEVFNNRKNRIKWGNILMVALWLIITGILMCVYLIKGLAGVYTWNISIFGVAPIAALTGIICLIVLVVRCTRRTVTRRLVLFQLTLLVMAFPILMLLGVVTVPFPSAAYADKVLVIDDPIGKDTVQMGGINYNTHVMWPSERYAYDILVKPYDIKSTKLSDYGVYGKSVYSPVNATVINIHDGEEDIAPNSDEFTSAAGNYIYLKVDKLDTYLIFAHLKKNSISVAVGDEVKSGTLLGQVGNSGTSSEPHLHLQHQIQNPMSVIHPLFAESLPIEFKK